MAPTIRRLKLNEILTLLDVLEQFPIVWNVKIKDYSNKSKREKQTKLLLEELAKRKLKMGEEEFRVRFKSIKDTYRKELRKVDDSMKRGDVLYVPRLAWYDRADTFLRDVVCTRVCPSNMQEEPQQIIAVCSLAGTDHEFFEHHGNQWVTVMGSHMSEDAESEDKPYKESNALMLRDLHSPGPSSESRSPGRSTENDPIGYIDLDNTTVIKCEPLDLPGTAVIPHTYDWDDPANCNNSSPSPSSVPPIASIPPTLCRIVKTTQLCQQEHIPTPEAPFKKPKTEEDRFDVFGKNVAYKLREMDKVQRILAEKIINDALFEAEMGLLTRNHKLTGESLSQPQVPCHNTSVHCISPTSSRSVSPSTVSMLQPANVSTADE